MPPEPRAIGVVLTFPAAPNGQYLATQWHLTSQEYALVLAAAEVAAVPAVFIGPVSDRLGPRRFVVASLACIGAATMVAALLPKLLWILVLSRFLFGLALAVFDVTAQNALLEITLESHRERVTGTLESSWSLSVLSVVPLLSLVLSRLGSGWALASLAAATALAGASLGLAYRHIPVRHPVSNDGARRGLRSGFVWSTGALAFNVSALLFSLAHNLILSEFGTVYRARARGDSRACAAFLIAGQYNLTIEEAGETQLVLGAAEFCGAVLVGAVGSSDAAFFLSSLAFVMGILVYALLGSLSVPGALFGLFFVYVPGEFGIILRLARASCFAEQADANSMLAVAGLFIFTGAPFQLGCRCARALNSRAVRKDARWGPCWPCRCSTRATTRRACSL